VENASPHKGVQFVRMFNGGLPVDVKVEVEVSADAEQVIFDVFDLFEFPQNLNILHLAGDELIESHDQLFTQLERKFIFSKVTQTLVQ
jgi:hypothetical protein